MKFYYFAVILVGMMILLSAAGLKTPSGSLAKTFNVLNATGGSFENFKNSDLWSKDTAPTSDSPLTGLKWIFTGLVIAGLVLGIFGKTPDIRYITAALIWILGGLIVSDLIFLYVQLNSYGIGWIKWVALSIFGSLTVGFFITAIEFWQGASD